MDSLDIGYDGTPASDGHARPLGRLRSMDYGHAGAPYVFLDFINAPDPVPLTAMDSGFNGTPFVKTKTVAARSKEFAYGGFPVHFASVRGSKKGNIFLIM